MADQSNYNLHGEVHPWIQKSTRNAKEVEKSDGPPKPWDQQPGETTTSYSAFLIYLDLGPHERSQSKLAKIIYGNESSTGQIGKWSVENDWINRAEAWDRFCAETRVTKMEEAIDEAEDVMLSYLPKVVLNLSQVAAGEKNVGRAQMRAITDFLDRVGPAKQRRAQPSHITNNVTINAPKLPSEVQDETDNIQDAEVIEESAVDLIPKDLKNKK